jgi:hypothetical protein
MAEEPDFAEMTWGELKEKIKNEPELADHPYIKKLLNPFGDLSSVFRNFLPKPRSQSTGEGPVFSLPAPPSPEKVELARARMLQGVIAAEVEPLRAKIAELSAALRMPASESAPERGEPVETPAPVEAPTSTSSANGSALDSLAKSKKRSAGRPTRKEEILKILMERHASGDIAGRVAAEAREIEKVLLERYKDGVQDGEPPVPKEKAIENLIRDRYAGLP